MVNYYSKKNIIQLKQQLKSRKLKKNIPMGDFRSAFMLCFGMNSKTAEKWIKQFQDTMLIKITKDKESKDKEAWIVNWLV